VKGKLVQLSRYGVMLKCLSRYINKVGIVLDTAVIGGNMHYEVMWTGDTRSVYNHMREVKRAK
jgi:alpha-glucosidase (family GH31 glycosyl hydrolase)